MIVENSDDESESISFNLEEQSKDSQESVKNSNEHFARVQGNEINLIYRKDLEKQGRCGVVAHETLTESRVTMD